MKTIFLVKKDPAKENVSDNWSVMGKDEFLEFINSPEGRKRAKNFGRLNSCGQNDSVIIVECGSDAAKKWKDEQNRHLYLRQAEREAVPYGFLSLSQQLDEDLTLEDTLLDEASDAESAAIEEIRSRELKRVLDDLDPMERSLIQMTVMDDIPVSLPEFGHRYHLDRSYLYRKREIALRKLRVLIRKENRDEKRN